MLPLLYTSLLPIIALQAITGYLSGYIADAADCFRPGMCFELSPESSMQPGQERITCILAQAGVTPNLEQKFDNDGKRCCFDILPRDAVFWAIGESLMSRVQTVAGKHGFRQDTPFSLEQAVLTDALILDAVTGDPVAGARVSMADDAVHLISYTKTSDDDGYAVFPVIADQPLTITVRADGYLAVRPAAVTYSAEPEEMIFELDPGISIAGTVTGPSGTPVMDAKIHVEVTRPDRSIWHSDIDRPRAVAAFASYDDRAWVPGRGSHSSDESGHFLMTTVPRGKIRVYATHPDFAPTPIRTADASDTIDTPQIDLHFDTPRRAWVRTENESGAAVPALMHVIDDTTGEELRTVTMPDSGAAELKILPKKVRFFAVCDGYEPMQTVREIRQNDEITIKMMTMRQTDIEIDVTDTDHHPIGNATLSPADPELRTRYPECIAKTDSSGRGILKNCPNRIIIDIFHPEYARTQFAADEKSPEMPVIVLSRGHDVEIQCIEQKTGKAIENVTCTLETDSLTGHPQIESAATLDGTIRIGRRPDLKHRMKCKAQNGAEASLEFLPAKTPKAIEFPYFITREIRVADSLGGFVPYAAVSAGGRTIETDETGSAQIHAEPGTEITVVQWQHGTTKILLHEKDTPLEIRLPDIPDENAIQCGTKLGMKLITDSASVLIDDPGNLARRGAARGDALESCRSESITVVRSDRRIRIDVNEL